MQVEIGHDSADQAQACAGRSLEESAAMLNGTVAVNALVFTESCGLSQAKPQLSQVIFSRVTTPSFRKGRKSFRNRCWSP